MGEAYAAPAGQTLRAGRHALPAWRRALAAGHWAAVGNTPTAVNPYSDAALNPLLGSSNAPWNGSTTMSGNRFANIITAWCGGVWHEGLKRLFITGGGHGDYAGNEWISCDLSLDTPAWSLASPPSGSAARKWSGWTPTAGVLDNGAGAIYPDGRPRAVHTYNNLAVDREGYLWLGGGSQFRAGSLLVCAAKFDPYRGDYVTLGDVNTFPYSAVNAWGLHCYDSNRHCLYSSNTGLARVRRYAIDADTWTQQIGYELDRGVYCMSLYDEARDIVVSRNNAAFLGGAHDTAEIEILNLANGTSGHPVVSGPVEFDWTTWHGRTGMAYYPPWDAYLVWPSGSATVYRLDPPAVGGDYFSGWALTALSTVAGAPTAGAANGTWGRFWASESLKCCGVINAVAESMHVFALE